MTFVRWANAYHQGFCAITQPDGITKPRQLLEGVSRAADWPDDIQIRMDPEFPKDLELSDNLYGLDMAVVSMAVKEALEAKQSAGVEFLPVEIMNHKGRSASKDYFILNPLEIVDCIDIDASGIDWNPLNSSKILGCEGLVLKPDSVPADMQIFRPQSWTKVVMIREELSDALAAANLTSMEFLPAVGYTGVG
ncbi:MAG: hypothetical protein ACI841_001387 [Planctomycetota bacterium]|jgi:hypothetical protein